MKRLLNLFLKMPAWLVFPVGLALVVVVGYVDYLTGDYSILVFYAIPIALAAWLAGDWGAVLISMASGYARYLSDVQSYSHGNVRYFNSIEDTLFLIIVGLLISAVKKLLDDEKRGKRN